MERNEWRGNIFERVKKELGEEQGCRLAGFVKVYRVPGNIHFASHAMMDVVTQLRMLNYTLDFSYKIHHLSFGNKEDFDYIKKNFEDLEMEHPADGIAVQTS
jgi:hypothetical protein